MNPVLAAHQLVNISLPGQQPPLWEAQEDMRLMSEQLADAQGGWVAWGRRGWVGGWGSSRGASRKGGGGEERNYMGARKVSRMVGQGSKDGCKEDSAA